jgi:hypothetical protein
LAFIAIVSCFMHYIQHRRRISLELRVRSGEVNLEAMNIKRVRVPIEHVEKFPLFTYNYEPTYASPPTSPISPQLPDAARLQNDDTGLHQGKAAGTDRTVPGQTARSTTTGLTVNTTSTDYQPKCMICEEDYEIRLTIIRELPCGHIYHPDCIDEYLSSNSSLCPLCKASMLPKGYCPEITNAMVRRERAVRRLRGSITVEDAELESQPNGWMGNLRRKKLFRPSRDLANAVAEAPPRHSASLHTRMRMRDLAGNQISEGHAWDAPPRCKSSIPSFFLALDAD